LGIWGFGDSGIRGFGDLGIWGFGDSGIWGFGDLVIRVAKPGHSNNQIPKSPNNQIHNQQSENIRPPVFFVEFCPKFLSMQIRRLLPFLAFLVLNNIVFAQIDNPRSAFRELRRGLEGTWFMPTDRGDRLEIWWTEDDSTMVGKNVRIRPENGDTVLLERLRLELRDTTVTYIAIPRNQNNNEPIPFRLTDIDEDGFFIFSNPNHDDPKVIRYLLLGNREMQVETIGMRNGREVKQEFVFEREFTPGAVEFRLRGGFNAHSLRGTGTFFVDNGTPQFDWKPGWELGTQARFKGRGGFITINAELSAVGRRSGALSSFTVFADTTDINYYRGRSKTQTANGVDSALTYSSVWLVLSVMPELTFGRDGRLSIMAGPYYGRLVSLTGKGPWGPSGANANSRLFNDFKKSEFGIQAGFQYRLNFGKKDIGGILGIRATYGLSNIDRLYSRVCDNGNSALCNGQLAFLGASMYYSVNLMKL